MSSHHVVREKQEPALLVLSLKLFSREYLGQLLEWSPTVIATPDSFEQLHSEGIKLDWLIGSKDFSSTQNDVKMIPAKSSDYLSDAIEALLNNGYPAVNIISDSFESRIFKKYGDRIGIVLYNNNEKCFMIKSGYEKWMPAGATIKIRNIPDGFVATNIATVSKFLNRVVYDGIVRIEFDTPYLVISEFL